MRMVQAMIPTQTPRMPTYGNRPEEAFTSAFLSNSSGHEDGSGESDDTCDTEGGAWEDWMLSNGAGTGGGKLYHGGCGESSGGGTG